MDIANQTLAGLLACVRDIVDPNVDNNAARLEHLAMKELGLADRSNDNISRFELERREIRLRSRA